MSKSSKEAVTCLVTVDGVITKRVKETRVVYTSRLARHVVVMGNRKPLNSSNEYILEYHSVPAMTGLEVLSKIAGC